ncbi:TspO and MBR related proteins [Formosa sp. Hel1_31_208]|uniref:TspO/MBR family protein n=1 Tax=Formosa sp. Hel1_31_208 TaxID=1798225 RepID=UPI00087949E0|nr:TspO/MBR family protein [Formosa sp. Hel1_31_208]SDS14926.1 TspO and MBR related proteins [Formosa sp. Hel1_31_208]
MKFLKSFIIFLIINFGALGIGTWLMADGAMDSWYQGLEKAPWTPEGWVFGSAWTTVMLCFSAYMGFLYLKRPTHKVLKLFIVQFVLNISWNFVFFNQHFISAGLINLVLLLIIVTAFFTTYVQDLKGKSILILPYLAWLCIATSLNLYIYMYN